LWIVNAGALYVLRRAYAAARGAYAAETLEAFPTFPHWRRLKVEIFLYVQGVYTLVFPSESHLCSCWHFAHSEGSQMAGKATKQAAANTNRPVTLKHLAATLAEEHELSKKAGEALLNDLVGLITKHLKKGERIRMSGLGILQVRKRAARMGRNPATGEAIKIKASKKVAFRAAKELKLAV
jgi:DNA-binding protein HU-beta